MNKIPAPMKIAVGTAGAAIGVALGLPVATVAGAVAVGTIAGGMTSAAVYAVCNMDNLSWEGADSAFVSGAVDGYMWGGIGSAISGIGTAIKASKTGVNTVKVSENVYGESTLEGSTNTVNPNALKYNGDGTWTSNSGLIYGQGSKEGNRVLHVLEHTKPNPNKPVHTVFNVDKSNVIGLVDEAWNNRGVGNLTSNGYVTYNIDMGKTIGTNGETFMRIVTNGYTSKLISAYPIP